MAPDDAGEIQGYRAPAKGGLAGWQSREIHRLVGADLADLTVGRMAQAVHLSLFHFSRAFRASYGVPPRDWLIEMRMAEARRRLVETRESIEQIAVAVGYSTSSQFSRAFRSRAGTSPQAFRRRS